MNRQVERAREAMRRLHNPRPTGQLTRRLSAIERGQVRLLAEAHRRDLRVLYWAKNLVWVWVGFAAMVSGVQFFVDPQAVERTAIGRALSTHFDYMWNGFFVLSGMLMIVGVIARRSRVEMVAHWCFNAGVIPDAMAILIVTGGGPSFWLTIGIGLASLSRLYYLVQTSEKR